MRSGLRRLGVALVAPFTIIAAALLPARAYLSALPVQGDIIYLWLPTYCFLGRTLRAGTIPLWDPHILGGTPFAADPQPMGWLYLLPMGLFTGLGCGTAMSAMIVLQPVLGGLGIYWFLRQERLSRPAAAVGGLVMATSVAGSILLIALPLAAALAWTALTLAAGSFFLNATTWASRLLRLLVLAVVWGQLVVAHFSVGGPMGTAALVAVFAARAWRDRNEGVPLRRSAAVAALAVAGLVAVNLAILAPRLAIIPRSNLANGYFAQEERAAELAGLPEPAGRAGPVAGAGWPLELATSAGAYAGGVALSLVFAGWWSRRLRPLTAGLSAFAVLVYVLPLAVVARRLPVSGDSFGPLQFYLHHPARLGYHMVVAVAALAGVGFQAWLDARSWGRRAAMLLPAAVLWAALPFAFGAWTRLVILPWMALAVAAALLAAMRLRPSLAAVGGTVLAVVVAADVLIGASTPIGGVKRRFATVPYLGPRRTPVVPAEEILRGGPLVAALEGRAEGRVAATNSHRVFGLARDAARVFRLETVSGYSSVQLSRFWTFLRASQGVRVHYNRASVTRGSPVLFDLLQVAWMAKRGPPPDFAGDAVARQGDFALYPVRDVPPRASVIHRWEVVGDDEEALAVVTADGFDPAERVVLEADPGIAQATGGGAGEATFRWDGLQEAVVEVETSAPAIVLVRNVYDPGWKAEVDGRAAPVLAADYVVQGIPVPAGRHTVRLVYEDRALRWGLIGSALAVALLVASALLLALRERRGGAWPLRRGAR